MNVNGTTPFNIFYATRSTVDTKTVENKKLPSFESTATTSPITAEASDAIKSQIGVSKPISYNSLGDFDIPNAGKAKLFKLANGQKIVILDKKGPTVLKTYFNVGSMNEPDKIRGISHFCEHMAFNGTENLGAGEFFKITNNMGAMTNASTGFSLTDYFISSQLLSPQDLEDSIKIQADMLQKPKYAPEMIEKEKGPVTSEISMVADVPENTALNNCIKTLFNIKTTSPDLVAGCINNIQNLNRDDAYNYYNTWYTPDNAITVVTGDVDADETMKLVSKYFNSTRTGKPEDRKYEDFKPITISVRTDVKMQKAQGTTVALGFSGPQNSSDKEYIQMELVLMSLLGYKGARISKALDKMQTSAMFSVERVGNRPQDPRAILMVGQSTPEKSEWMIKNLYNEINNLNVNPISKEELETAKKMLKLGYANLCEHSQVLNHFIGTSLMDNDLNYAKNYLNMLESITPEDLAAFSKKYLDLNKASLSVVHPNTLEDKTIEANYKNINLPKAVAFKGRLENKGFDLNKIQQNRLTNNMEVAFNPNKSDLSTYELNLDTKIPANTKPAVPVLLSVILNEGSRDKTYNELYTESNKKGIDIKFKADFNSMNANVNSLSDDTSYSLDIVKEVLMSPRFTPNSLAYAKNLVKDSLLNSQNSSTEELLRVLFPNSPEFATKEEGLKSLESTTMTDVIAFYNYVMQNAQASAVFTAPTEKKPELKDEVVKKLSVGFNKFKPAKLEHFESFTPIETNKIITKADPRNQADIVQAFKFKTNFNPKDHISISLMNMILGDGPYSRLFNDLREQQKLAYRVESNVDYHGNTGVLSLGIKTTTDNQAENVIQYDNVTKSLDGFKNHIEKIKAEKVSQEELDAAKLRYKTKILNSVESSAGQTNVLSNSKNTCFDLAATKESLKLIDEVTVDDIYNAANYIFNSNSVTSILASQNTLDNIKLSA